LQYALKVRELGGKAYYCPDENEMPQVFMDRKYWIVFIILIAILLYAIITHQFLMGVIVCIVVIILAWILSMIQHWDKFNM